MFCSLEAIAKLALAERQFLSAKHIDSVEKTNAKFDLNRYKNLRLSTRTNG